MEFRVCFHAPELVPGFKIQTVQDPFGAKGINTAPGNRRSTPRPFVESKIVPVICWIGKRPDLFPILGIEAFNNFLVLDPVEEDESSFSNHGRTEPLPRVIFQTTGGPSLGHTVFNGAPA